MELGELFFDTEDDLVKDIKAIKLPQYTPKYCEQEWFCGDDDEDDDNDVLKYKADLYYYKQNYQTALHLYERLLQVLPTTHSQLKREVVDSIVRCCIRCGLSDQGLSHCGSLVAPPHDKDHSSWQLMSQCHQHEGHIEDEVLCSLKCVLLARHFPPYWLQLHNSYNKLTPSSSLTINNDIFDHTLQLLRPYFNKQDVTDSSHPHYQLFIRYLTTPTSITESSDEHSIFLKVASLSMILRAQQLVCYTISRCHSSATKTSCQQLSDTIHSVLDTYTDDALKESLLKHMQTPFEIDI